MIWKKIGKIFDPTENKLPLGCFAYAQSPQTLVFDDYIRIYFSTRNIDSEGKFISQIAFVDVDKSFTRILRISDSEVIALGERGAFDEHGIFPLHIFKENKNIYGYICGLSRRMSVTVESSIGLSESKNNGETFSRISNGPVLTSSLNEPFLVCDPFVMKVDDNYHMWYIYGLRWIRESPEKNPDRVYKIAHAVSKDQIHWTKEGRTIVPDTIDVNECQALPTVIKIGNRYHMIFCFRHAFGFRDDASKGYRLGYAWSDDLINWTRNDEEKGIDVSVDSWDSDMQCYPHLFEMDGKIYLLYNGNEFGKFGFGLAVLEQ